MSTTPPPDLAHTRHNPMNNGAADAQRVMNELGFIVIHSTRKRQQGDIFQNLFGCDGYDDIHNANIVIIGPATLEDARAQERILGLPPEIFSGHLYKAIAE